MVFISCLLISYSSQFVPDHYYIIWEKVNAFNLVEINAFLKGFKWKDNRGHQVRNIVQINASVELNSRNFDALVLKSKDLWNVEFFAPW